MSIVYRAGLRNSFLVCLLPLLRSRRTSSHVNTSCWVTGRSRASLESRLDFDGGDRRLLIFMVCIAEAATVGKPVSYGNVHPPVVVRSDRFLQASSLARRLLPSRSRRKKKLGKRKNKKKRQKLGAKLRSAAPFFRVCNARLTEFSYRVSRAFVTRSFRSRRIVRRVFCESLAFLRSSLYS